MSKLAYYNILLVEDEPLLLRSLERCIRKLDMGFEPITAQNGQEAIELLKNSEIHLIISDIIMPIVSGLELLEYVDHHLPHIPVIILSGHADFTYAQTALRTGAFDYILKPFSEERIENILLKAKLKLGSQYHLLEEDTLSGKSTQQSIEYARLYLKEHYADQIDLNLLAKKLGYSPAYLTKMFNKHEKCSPLRYLTNLRISKAKNLLRNTDLPIKEIGEQVGYESQFYFSRVFRKLISLSPSEYRDTIKEKR